MIVTSQWPSDTTHFLVFDLHLCPSHYEKGSATRGKARN